MAWTRSFPKKGADRKYGNSSGSLCLEGHSHRSKLERAVCDMYHYRKLAGEFTEIHCEVHVRICGKWGHDCNGKQQIQSVVDFKLTRPDGTVSWGESKGFPTPEWRLKRRLWIHYDIGKLEVWGGTWSRPTLLETLCA